MEKWGKGYKIYSAKGRTMNTKQGRLCIELGALIGTFVECLLHIRRLCASSCLIPAAAL